MRRRSERLLASDARAGTFARRKSRTEQRRYLRKHGLRLAAFYVVTVAVMTVPALLFSSDFVQGFVVGGSLAGLAGALAVLVVVQTGTGPTMAGEQAEQWTAQELRPLTEHGYKLVNHVVVDGRGDVDHLLVGPGGLFVLETKWSATPWTKEDRFFAAPLEQLGRKARSTWLQVKRHGVPQVTPVLVLWGRAAEPLASGTGVRSKDGVYVVAGGQLQRWLLTRAPGVLSVDTIAATYEDIARLAGRTDANDDPVPRSAEDLTQRAFGLLMLTVLTFYAVLSTAQLHVAAYAVSGAGLLTAGLVLRRRHRWIGAAVAAGALIAVLLGTGAVLVTILA